MDMHELAKVIAREILDRIRGEEKRPFVMVLGSREECVAVKIRESLDVESDVLFLGEDVGGRMPERYILPVLSCNDMASLAAGRASGAVAVEVLRLLLSGIHVEVLEFAYTSHSETAPGPLYALYQSYEKTLETYGLIKFRHKRPGAAWCRESLVTAAAVEQAQASEVQTLLVPATAVITPLAAERAKSLHIRIVKQ